MLNLGLRDEDFLFALLVAGFDLDDLATAKSFETYLIKLSQLIGSISCHVSILSLDVRLGGIVDL